MFTKTEKDLLDHFNISAIKQSSQVVITSPIDVVDFTESKNSSSLSDFVECETDCDEFGMGPNGDAPIMNIDFSNAFEDFHITKDGKKLMSTSTETIEDELKLTIETFKRAEDMEAAGFKLEILVDEMGERSTKIPIIYAETGVHLIIPKVSNKDFNIVEGNPFRGDIRAFVLTSPSGDAVYVDGNRHGQIRDLLKMQYNMMKALPQTHIEGIDFPTELPANAPKLWTMRVTRFNEPVCKVSDDSNWILVEKNSLTQLHNMMADQLGDSRFEYLNSDEAKAIHRKIDGRFPMEGSENFDQLVFDVVKELHPDKSSHPLLSFISFGNEDEVTIYETEHYIIWNTK